LGILLGILLIIACGGNLVDAVVQVLFPNIDATISQFTFVGELLLPLWLVFKGVNVEQWQPDALTDGCGRGCGVTRACCRRGRTGPELRSGASSPEDEAERRIVRAPGTMARS
jgi:hypothetical protein